MRTLEELPQILEDAADFLEQHRWIKGSYTDYEGGYCAIGAVREVAGAGAHLEKTPKGITYSRQIFNMEAVINKHVRNDPYNQYSHVLAGFNDAAKSKRQVVRLLRRIAKKLKNS